MILLYAFTFVIFLSLHTYIKSNKKNIVDRPTVVPEKYLTFKNAMKTIKNLEEYHLPT